VQGTTPLHLCRHGDVDCTRPRGYRSRPCMQQHPAQPVDHFARAMLARPSPGSAHSITAAAAHAAALPVGALAARPWLPVPGGDHRHRRPLPAPGPCELLRGDVAHAGGESQRLSALDEGEVLADRDGLGGQGQHHDSGGPGGRPRRSVEAAAPAQPTRRSGRLLLLLRLPGAHRSAQHREGRCRRRRAAPRPRGPRRRPPRSAPGGPAPAPAFRHWPSSRGGATLWVPPLSPTKMEARLAREPRAWG